MEIKFGTNFAIGMVDIPIVLPVLAKTCLEQERELLKLPWDGTSGTTGLNENHVSTRSLQYNLFDWHTFETQKLHIYYIMIMLLLILPPLVITLALIFFAISPNPFLG